MILFVFQMEIDMLFTPVVYSSFRFNSRGVEGLRHSHSASHSLTKFELKK